MYCVPAAELDASAPMVGGLASALFPPAAPVGAEGVAGGAAAAAEVAGGVASGAAAAVRVAEDAEAPVNADVPASSWDESESLLISLSDSTAKLISAAYTARQWFDTPSPDRAVLPDMSVALFYRLVLFCDIEARISLKVVCSLYTEVRTVWVAALATGAQPFPRALLQLYDMAIPGVTFSAIARHTLAGDVPGPTSHGAAPGPASDLPMGTGESLGFCSGGKADGAT